LVASENPDLCEEALVMAESFQPDLLISGLAMTGITGIEARLKFAHSCPSCRVLLFSGQPAAADLLEKARA
jgi:DNA-binding NarL/FixJ family response regulator